VVSREGYSNLDLQSRPLATFLPHHVRVKPGVPPPPQDGSGLLSPKSLQWYDIRGKEAQGFWGRVPGLEWGGLE
jgi:hypothetical protein